MRRTELLATALGAVLLTAPAFAQRGDTMHAMHRDAASPSARMQDHASGMVDRASLSGEPAGWLEQAQTALRRNKVGEANELLERAETRLLTRSPATDMTGGSAQDPAIGHFSAARSALMSRDRAGAAREAEAALASVRGVAQDDMAAGGTGQAAPAQGGGRMGSGAMMMRDGGTGGTTLSRADHIILAQGGGGGGGGSSDSSQTGGLNAATPGSPAAGNLGSTPQQMQGRSEQPAQGSAVPLAPSAGRGGPDPSALPGARQEAPGGTGVMPGDRTRR